MNTNEPKYTKEQLKIIEDYGRCYGIEHDQISFNGAFNTGPIFDAAAVATLSLMLTDIRSIEVTNRDRNGDAVVVYVKAVLPDGRDRGVAGTCLIGEILPNGDVIETETAAGNVAESRAFRKAIRALGIDLHKAHLHFVENGRKIEAVPESTADRQRRLSRNIHRIAEKIGYIHGDDRSLYEKFLAKKFNGRTSTLTLSTDELEVLEHEMLQIERLHDGPDSSAPAAMAVSAA